MIPRGEISATGQSIVEFEDIDGTTYHGFMTPAGNFIPIARVDHTGNRLPIAMKPDGGICIAKSYGSQELAAPPDDHAEEYQATSDIDRVIIEFKDKNGAIVRGYKNQSGQFVPVSHINNDGVERTVMMKTDGKFYIGSLNDDCDGEEVDLSNLKFELFNETCVSHPAVLSHSQNITEVVSHDGFTYQGFESPKFGFIPTARIDADGARRPVIMNAEGEYTVVNGDGRMIGVKVQCQSDDLDENVKCTGCRFPSQSQSQTRMLFNGLSSTLSDSSDTSLLHSAGQVDSPIDNIMQIDHWEKTDANAPPPSRKSSRKLIHMTYKREHDGSIYHGCCQSGQFIPVFRLDEQGYRYPVIKDSDGKLYTVDKDGQNLYTDLDEKGNSTKGTPEVVTRKLNGNTFEGRCTIDGRFIPMYCIDDHGNKKAVTSGRNGYYIFSGSNGHINFVKFPAADNEVNLISGFNPAESAVTAVRTGDDGFKYEGYTANDGEFIPTVRTDKTGYRQMVLINSEDQGYVIGYNGEKELVPFVIPPRATKAMMKQKLLHTPSRKSTQSKCFQGSDDNDDGDLISSAMMRSSPIRMQSQGNHFLKEGGDVDSLGNTQNLSGGDLDEQRTVKEDGSDHDLKENWEQHTRAESPLIETNASSSTSLTNPHKDGTVIFRESRGKESSKDMRKSPSKMSHSGNSSKLDKSAKSAKSHENQLRRSPGAGNNKDVRYLGIDDSNSTSENTDGQVAVDIVNNKNRNIKEKPIVKNTAVRNVTGRPDMRAGQFKKHVFATPHENLTKTTGLGRETNLLNSQDTGSTNIGDIEPFNRETKLPSLQKKTGLPPINQKDREVKSIAQGQSSRQRSESLSISLPDQGTSDQGNTLPLIESTLNALCPIEGTPDALPPIEGKQSESRSRKSARNTIADEKEQYRQASFADIGQEVELEQENGVNDKGQSSGDILSKYSEFQLTADSTLPPPLLSQSPPPLDKEPAYQIAYSTSPNLLGNKSSPIPISESSVGQTFSSEQEKSPEPITLNKESKKVKLSTLPMSCDEDIVPVSKVPSQNLMKASLRPTRSIYRSGTTLASRSSNRMHGVTDSMPNSVSKIWQQHKRQVDFLRQTFYLPLTPAFTFSMFELPKEYQKHNSAMRQKAKQIRTMKKPTSLGKPPQIMLRPPLPLKKAPLPLKSIPYRIKAKIAKA
ncbi:uncharacterized protein LOC135153416 [Lytechinus pictus]|uniref:uncharacterized protein LOC135153416 n=1 Tax=Lytechinus pictus TaxID=7653 RepID=UPI0030B9F617